MTELATRHRGDTLTPEERAALDDIALNFEKDGTDPFAAPDTLEGLVEPPDEGESAPGVSPEASYDLVLVDQSQDARDFARDRADARLSEELNEGGRFKRFVKGIWKGNVARDYYRQKYIREAQADIQGTQDVLTHEEADADRRGRAIQATIERFQSEQPGLIHENAGENRQEIDTESGIAHGLKGIISQYAKGELSDEALQEERTRVIEAYREAHGNEALGEGLVQIDNILSVAQSVKGAVEHGESLDNIMRGMRIITGEARSGARSAAHYDKVDRVLDKLAQSKVGSVVAPEILTAAVTSAASLLRMGSKAAIGAAAMTVVPGLGAGIVAGLRERKRTKDERVQHAREMAQGKEFQVGDKRREQMEATRYETRSAVELQNELQSHFDEENLNEGGQEALHAAIDALAAVEARIRYADCSSRDLISYSDVALVTEERMQLDIAVAEAKVRADRRLDAQTRQSLGLEDDGTVGDYLEYRVEDFYDLLEEDMSVKDKAARKLVLRRSLGAAGVGMVGGMVMGVAAQEIGAALSSSRSGLVEQLWHAETKLHDGAEHQTLLNGLIGHESSAQVTPSGNYNTEVFGGKSTFSLSSEYSIGRNDDGTLNILSGDGSSVAEHIKLNDDGTLSPEAIEHLRQQGAVVEDLSFTKEVTTVETKTVGLEEYLANHQQDTTHITRDFWYDNNTPWAADGNETGLHWGNGGFDAQGNYHMNVAGMTEGGSVHGGQSVDWATEAQNGNLQIAISASQDSQTQVFMLDINPDGSVVIPQDSPAAKFFENSSDVPVFNGQYAEIVQKAGIDANGVEHVRPLATFVGEGDITTLQDTVETRTNVIEPNYKITMPSAGEAPTFTEMAPVLPFTSRRALETVWRRGEVPRRRGNYYSAHYGEQYLSPREMESLREETSPRLWNNPDGKLNPFEELSWYKKLIETKKGIDYSEKIKMRIDASPELSELKTGIKAIVAMPVNAAGKTEAAEIYNVLANAYAQQDKAALAQTMFLLNVNHFTDLSSDPEAQVTIEQTKREIERAKRDFPQLNLAVFDATYDREEVTATGGVIGYIARDLYDTALMSVANAMEEGRMQPDEDVLIIRNDADPKGIDRNYLRSFIDAAQDNEEPDILTGTLSFDSSRATDLPGFVFATTFMQSINVIASVRDGSVHFAGPNSAIRASSMAAAGGMGFDEYSGAGSDDVYMGQRIVRARRGLAPQTGKALRGYYRQQLSQGGNRKVGLRVKGARIESDSDRLEAVYRRGVPIIHTWDSGAFDGSAGYVDRSASLDELRSQNIGTEDIQRDPNAVIEHIRKDMEGTLRLADDAHARTALAFVFSNMEGSSTDGYRLSYGNDGAITGFELTQKGKDAILKRLTRNTQGQPETYATRKARQLFGEGRKRLGRNDGRRSPMTRI